MSHPRYPENEFTRAIEETAQLNAAGGGHASGVASATPLPSVRSADYGRVIEDEPLTPERIAELDHLARAAGVKDERLGNADPDTPQTTYATQEAAEEAAAPVRQTAREFLATRARGYPSPLSGPQRMPDFRLVQRIDFVTGTVEIDGFRFPIPADEVKDLVLYAVKVARDHIMRELDQATQALDPAEEHEEVPEVREGEGQGD